MAQLKSWLGRLRRRTRVYSEALRDAHRHVAYGGVHEDRVTPDLRGRRAERQLTKDYHRVEKGLALPSPRQPFGDTAEQRLTSLLRRQDPDVSSIVAEHAKTALEALHRWNTSGLIDKQISPLAHTVTAGLNRADSWTPAERSLLSRRSLRHFTGEAPNTEAIRRAVRIATTTPSVCNRQAWFAHYFTGTAAERVLELQNGNAGFRGTIPGVFVITADVQLFSGPSERNQRWIDGGLFAMTLALALHAGGIDTCFLNWSQTNTASDRLRERAAIPENEDIVTLLAVGIAASGARVARSPRRSVDEILRLHPTLHV